MQKVIELYVRTKAVPVGLEYGYYLKSPGHECTKTPVTRLVTENVLPEVDQLALKVAEEVARDAGVELKVYDITSFKGKIKASFNGVKKTPDSHSKLIPHGQSWSHSNPENEES